jgi:hypothetical protein
MTRLETNSNIQYQGKILFTQMGLIGFDTILLRKNVQQRKWKRWKQYNNEFFSLNTNFVHTCPRVLDN